MSWIDDLPVPLAVLVAVGGLVLLPLAGSVAAVRMAFRRTRGLADQSKQRLLRSACLGVCCAPTLIVEASPSVHGALVLPHFAWFGLLRGLLAGDGRGALPALCSMAVVAALSWSVLHALRKD